MSLRDVGSSEYIGSQVFDVREFYGLLITTLQQIDLSAGEGNRAAHLTCDAHLFVRMTSLPSFRDFDVDDPILSSSIKI